ncbi:MAG: hypothetical protein ACPG7F_02785, partial [Aggregatilineales bacterium]
MLSSLRYGILLSMLTVAGVAIVTITLFAGFTTRVGFSQYVEAEGEARKSQLQQAVFTYWTDNIAPDGTETLNQARRNVITASLSDGDDMLFLNPTDFRFYPIDTVDGDTNTTAGRLAAINHI